MDKILFNNHMVDREILIDVDDRCYQFGDGIYEVVGVYNKKLFLTDEHLDRLERSANELGIELPFTKEVVKSSLIKLTETNNVIEGLVYLQVSRGVAPRTHELPVDKVSPVVVAYTKHLGDFTDLQNAGSTAILEEDIRWLRCDIKSLNLLPNTMAKQKAVENNAIEAILHRGETVTEDSSTNVFIVQSSELYIHLANNLILNGITRQQVIKLCEKLNLKVNEKTYTVENLLEADEVFITATKLDVVGITKVNDMVIGDGEVGEITLKLLSEFRKLTNNI